MGLIPSILVYFVCTEGWLILFVILISLVQRGKSDIYAIDFYCSAVIHRVLSTSVLYRPLVVDANNCAATDARWPTKITSKDLTSFNSSKVMFITFYEAL
jgi:hypothetical protein